MKKALLALKGAVPLPVKRAIKSRLYPPKKVPAPNHRPGEATIAPRQLHSAVPEDARPDLPVVVSFYAGSEYYHQAGENLAASCSAANIPYDIRELILPPDQCWSQITRHKIGFYRAMLEEHRRPIIWVDVDSTILRVPDEIRYSSADVTCFLRNFKYLPKFDPLMHGRMFSPPFYRFAYNSYVLAFLDFAYDLERKSNKRATDDYFIQEAITRWPGDLRFMLLRPSDVCNDLKDPTAETAILMNGHSGSAGSFAKKMTQHTPRVLAPEFQKKVLLPMAREMASNGDIEGAKVFYRRMISLDKKDVAIQEEYERLP